MPNVQWPMTNGRRAESEVVLWASPRCQLSGCSSLLVIASLVIHWSLDIGHWTLHVVIGHSHSRRCRFQRHGLVAPPRPPEPRAVNVEIDDRSGVKGQYLAHDQPADNGDAQRPAEF